MLLRAILCGGVRNGFLLGNAKKQEVKCQFLWWPGWDGHLFWECSFHPVLHVRELPEFASLLARDRSVWHGWLPGHGVAGDGFAWSASRRSLEPQLGTYPADGAGFGVPRDFWDAKDLAIEVGDHPCVWTDGGREHYPKWI